MFKKINIHRKGEILQFTTGVCKIDIIGGWDVTLGEFSIKLKNIKNGKVLEGKRVFWRLQSWDYGKRSKRIFMIDIIEPGEYEIEFINPEHVKLKHSGLFLLGLFSHPLKNENLEIGLLN